MIKVLINIKISVLVLAVFLFFADASRAEDAPSYKIYSEIMTDSMIKQWMPIVDSLQLDPGHYKTFLWVDPCPEKPFRITCYRPLDERSHNEPFCEKVHDEASGEIFYKDGKALIFSVASKGFLLGEEIILLVYDKDSNKIAEEKVIPFPLAKSSPVDHAEISLKLFMISPMMYEVRFRGFPKDECLKMESESEHESMPETVLPKLEGICVNYSPDVINSEGGTAKLTFTRKSGEKITFRIPWGDCLIPYLNGFVLAPKVIPFETKK